MKATDLMIGDWVQGFVPDTYSRVEAIREHRLGIITSGGHYIETAPDDFQPIPLTHEILEKNGFKLTSYGLFRYKNNGVRVTIAPQALNISVFDRENDTFNYYAFPRIEFVHELQHALRLCGIEKEVEP